ncbi:small GTP-binding protein [Histomonas meleagridis]|uniref:small GTP-binding protein n=1 Tax=Histomonas meleagridis TaxID=135588 RepID=UPI00355AB387|nr:small GTP-binding protein [Histomonas meleagridis]KAH0796607.1 small GTP-binding protein [Histomonas meleagridis]
MSGDDSYFEVRNEFYSDTDGFLIVFDISSRDSFNQIGRWIDEAKKYGADLSSAVLCGNKSDSPKASVSIEEANAYAKKLGIQFFETSAKSGKNVSETFYHLFSLVLAKMKNRLK